MFARLHSTRRLARAAVFVLLLAPMAGCALLDKETYNLDRYRDERSVDIERRLERTEPIVQNPF
jgi:hypothetical protein